MKITKSATEITRSFGSSTSYNNSGGLLPSGTDSLQEAIDALAGSTAGLYLTVIRGGQGTTQNLSTLGATETIDLGNANYFYGTLDQNCTISFTGWTTGKDSQITVEVTEDGTGGWTPTFSGVTWIGGTTPTHDTTAGSVSLYVFISRDGGTTIYGMLVGGGGSDLSLVTVAATGSTETVDVSVARTYDLTLTANCTLTLTGAVSGEAWFLTLVLRQDGTGSRTVTWPGSVVWPGGVTPTLSTAAASVDVFTLFTLDGGTVWFGFPTGGSGGSALTIKDEGSSLATAATSLDFVGAGVTASGTGAAKTITIPSTGIQLASIAAASSAIAATEAVVVSASLGAGTIVAGNSYRIVGAGVGTTGVTPGTDTFRIRIGPTTLTGTIPTSATALGVAAVTGQSFNFVAIITVRTSGASGTIIGECVAFSANVATGRYATLNNLSATTASVAIDTTVTNLLELTFQSGNAGSSNTFHVATIEQLTTGPSITSFPTNGYSAVDTDETTTSSSFTALSTAGPIVTITVNTKVKITLSCDIYGTTSTTTGNMGVVLSGANTVAASDTYRLTLLDAGSGATSNQASRVIYYSGLTPGSTVFTCQYYRGGTGTAHFRHRQMLVECLD